MLRGVETRAAYRQSTAVVGVSDPELRYHYIPIWWKKKSTKKIKGRIKEVKLQKAAGEDQATREVLNFCNDELII